MPVNRNRRSIYLLEVNPTCSNSYKNWRCHRRRIGENIAQKKFVLWISVHSGPRLQFRIPFFFLEYYHVSIINRLTVVLHTSVVLHRWLVGFTCVSRNYLPNFEWKKYSEDFTWYIDRWGVDVDEDNKNEFGVQIFNLIFDAKQTNS